MKNFLKNGQHFYLLDSSSAANDSSMLKHHLDDYQR